MDWKWIVVVILIFAVSAVGYWGYNQYLATKNIDSELNNRYEDSFQGVNHHIDALEAEIGTILVANSADNLSVNLSNVWRSAYSAQENLGQLPVSNSSLNNVKDLLHNVLQYTNHLDKKVVDGGLSDKDKKVMKSFHQQVAVANKNLEAIHDKMDRKKFKWYDKKRVKMDQDDREYSASPLSGLAEMDDKLKLDDIKKELKSVVPQGAIKLKEEDVITSLSQLKGNSVNEKEAISIAKKFIKNPEDYNYDIIDDNRVEVENGKTVRTHLPAHSVKATNKENKEEVVYMDITKKGGNVIWILNQRNTEAKKITYKKAEKEAAQFLRENGYEDMVVSSSKPFNDIMMISLAPKQNEVLIKPDAVSVQIALDKGEIIGFNGVDYLLHHKDRPMSKLKPKLTVEEAKSKVSKNLKIKKEPQLVLDRRGGKEVLAYEFVGLIGEENGAGSYKVMINAMTGKEEVVKSIDQDIYKNIS